MTNSAGSECGVIGVEIVLNESAKLTKGEAVARFIKELNRSGMLPRGDYKLTITSHGRDRLQNWKLEISGITFEKGGSPSIPMSDNGSTTGEIN